MSQNGSTKNSLKSDLFESDIKFHFVSPHVMLTKIENVLKSTKPVPVQIQQQQQKTHKIKFGNTSKLKKDIKLCESSVFIFDFKHVFVCWEYLFA